MLKKQGFCLLVCLIFLFVSCGSQNSGSNVVDQKEPAAEQPIPEENIAGDTHTGGCILTTPVGEVPEDLYQMSDVIQTEEYLPFTKKLTVCGITLIGRDDISDEFMKNVAVAIKSLFSREGDIDVELQEELLTNMYKYRATIPFFKGHNYEFSPEDEKLMDITRSKNSICDIIMEGVPTQINEVMEHILHHITDVGLHYTFPDEWGISTTSAAHKVTQEAIDKGYYDVKQYGDAQNEELNRVLIQEYAYWIIFDYWELREVFFPRDAEFNIKTGADLKAKLPQSYELVRQTIPKVMAPPNNEQLIKLFGKE